MEYHFDIGDAIKYGVEPAVLLYNLRFWILKNKANKKHSHDGRTWTYNSLNAYVEQFPFWSRWKIHRFLKALREKGVIRMGSFNKAKYDRTGWYAFEDESLLHNCNMDIEDSQQGRSETATPIPDTNTDRKPDTSLMREGVEKKLFTKVQDSFVSQNENSSKLWNWPAQAKHIKGLVNRAMHMHDPEYWLKSVITTYFHKIRTGDKFWHTQPFTPMNLNSEGIMTRVLAEMAKEPVDMGAIIREAGLK